MEGDSVQSEAGRLFPRSLVEYTKMSAKMRVKIDSWQSGAGRHGVRVLLARERARLGQKKAPSRGLPVLCLRLK
jgi:hypothetical protein